MEASTLLKHDLLMFQFIWKNKTHTVFKDCQWDANVADFFAKKKEVFSMASTSCLPSVVRMGIMLNELSLHYHVQFFKEQLKGLLSRLPSIYSVYRLFAFEVNG